MTVDTYASGQASWVNQAHASTTYGDVSPVKVQTGTKYAFIRRSLGTRLRAGATIASAHLLVPTSGALTGSRTFTAQRAAASWKPRSLAWNNKPGVTGASTVVTVGSVGAGHVIDFNVTADFTAWLAAGGTSHPGWRIVTNDSNTINLDADGAELVVDYSYTPAAPTDLAPDGIVSVAKPTLTFSAGDTTALQVQIDPTGAFTSPTLDTGTVVTTAHEYPLTDSTYGGLSTGQSTQWRVRVLNDSGSWSPYSSPATFSRTAKPALTIVAPTTTVVDSQALLDADMTGMVAVQWFVAKESSPATPFYNSGMLASTNGQHLPTRPVFTDETTPYRVTVRGWDDVEREATPGDPPYNETSVTTTLNYSLVTTGPDTVTAAQVGATPSVTVTFTENTPGDAYTILRDGESLGRFDTADLFVSGTTYRYTDWGAPSGVPVIYTVQPHADDEQGEGVSSTVTTFIGGRWLVDPANGDHVLIWNDQITWAQPETAAIHTPESSPYVVRRRLGRRKPEGAIVGDLADTQFGTVLGDMATLERWADPNQTAADKVFRLVLGHLNLPVWLGDIDCRPNDVRGGVSVSFSFWTADVSDAQSV